MNNVPRRDRNRPSFAAPKRDLAAEINADIARRAALPKDHPDYAVDDSDTTGVMGIRDNAALRENASKLTRDSRKKQVLMAKDISPVTPPENQFDEVPQQQLPDSREAREAGLSEVEGSSARTHANGKPRVLFQESTQEDPYTGDLTHEGFNYIETLFKNNPSSSRPLACEAPGTRHRGNATSFIKLPGENTHKPVCGHHLEKYLREGRLNPTQEQTAPYETFGGGENYTHYPIAEGHPLDYRIHRAKQKKMAEFRDEKLAHDLGAENWSARKKTLHGPGRAPKPQTEGENWWDVSGLTEGSTPENNIEAVVQQARQSGGKTRVHLAHQALVHAMGIGGSEPNKAVYLTKSKELGLSETEAQSLLVPAIQHHKRITGSASVIPEPVQTKSRFKQAAEDVVRDRAETMTQDDVKKFEVDTAGSPSLKEHYDTLGVKPGASWDEIHDSFRTLAKTAHPDVEGGSVEAMTKLTVAHNALRTSRLGAGSSDPLNVFQYMADQIGDIGPLPKRRAAFDDAAESARISNLMQPGIPTARSTKRK